jgi:hypothetical protein
LSDVQGGAGYGPLQPYEWLDRITLSTWKALLRVGENSLTVRYKKDRKIDKREEKRRGKIRGEILFLTYHNGSLTTPILVKKLVPREEFRFAQSRLFQ